MTGISPRRSRTSVTLSPARNPQPRFETSAAALSGNLAVLAALIRKGEQVRRADSLTVDDHCTAPVSIGAAKG